MLILANRSGDGAQTRPAGIPSIRDAALERTSFEVGKLPSPAADASSARAAPVGTTIRYQLSKWGVVVFTVERKTTGRRSGAKCVAGPASGAPCTILSKAGEFVLEGTQGQESVPFDGRIGEKALAPGHYLLILEERDLVGRPSNTTALRFRILPAR